MLNCSLYEPTSIVTTLQNLTTLQIVIASEKTTVGTEEDGTLAVFTAVLAVPAVAWDAAALLAAAGGDADLAEGVRVYLASRWAGVGRGPEAALPHVPCPMCLNRVGCREP